MCFTWLQTCHAWLSDASDGWRVSLLCFTEGCCYPTQLISETLRNVPELTAHTSTLTETFQLKSYASLINRWFTTRNGIQLDDLVWSIFSDDSAEVDSEEFEVIQVLLCCPPTSTQSWILKDFIETLHIISEKTGGIFRLKCSRSVNVHVLYLLTWPEVHLFYIFDHFCVKDLGVSITGSQN